MGRFPLTYLSYAMIISLPPFSILPPIIIGSFSPLTRITNCFSHKPPGSKPKSLILSQGIKRLFLTYCSKRPCSEISIYNGSSNTTASRDNEPKNISRSIGKGVTSPDIILLISSKNNKKKKKNIIKLDINPILIGLTLTLIFFIFFPPIESRALLSNRPNN